MNSAADAHTVVTPLKSAHVLGPDSTIYAGVRQLTIAPRGMGEE